MGVRFHRQHPIGPYIVDFCSCEKKLIIEVDGALHQETKEYDSERTRYLGKRGCRVIRFWNHEIMNNLEDVLERIKYTLQFRE